MIMVESITYPDVPVVPLVVSGELDWPHLRSRRHWFDVHYKEFIQSLEWFEVHRLCEIRLVANAKRMRERWWMRMKSEWTIKPHFICGSRERRRLLVALDRATKDNTNMTHPSASLIRSHDS